MNSNLMKFYTYLPIAVLALFLGSCGSHDENKTTELEPVAVTVATAASTGSSRTVSVSGRIEAGNSANISTRMMGSVTRVLVQPGEKVRKGQLLLSLSSADLRAKKAQVQASIVQAKSNYTNAKKDYERFSELFSKGSASEKELENITTRYEAAEAGLSAAREMEKEVNAQFAYTNLRAPFDGVVANTFVKVGDIANPGMSLVSVEGTSGYEATVLIPETQIAAVKTGAGARVLIKSTGKSLDGTVIEVSPSARNTGGQFLVKIGLKETEGIYPGMFVSADIEAEGNPQVSTSPLVRKSALVQNGQLTGLYALSDKNTAVLRWVRLGRQQGEQVEVLSGIRDGETYIVDAQGKIFNGAPVEVR